MRTGLAGTASGGRLTKDLEDEDEANGKQIFEGKQRIFHAPP